MKRIKKEDQSNTFLWNNKASRGQSCISSKKKNIRKYCNELKFVDPMVKDAMLCVLDILFQYDLLIRPPF